MIQKIENDFFKCEVETDNNTLLHILVHQTKSDGSLDLNEFKELSRVRVMKDYNNYYDINESVDVKELVLCSGIREILPCSFCNSNVEHIVWPADCEKIPSNLIGLSSVTKISNTDNVKQIDTDAFSESLIRSFVIPKAVTEIPSFCFWGAGDLSNLSNTDRLSKIGRNAFMSCKRLTKLSGLKSLLYIEENAFRESGVEVVDLSDSVCGWIGDYAFSDSKLAVFKAGYYLKNNPKAFERTHFQKTNTEGR